MNKIELNEKYQLSYLGTKIDTDPLERGRFIDLSDMNRNNLILFGKTMELENCFESIKRWFCTSRLGRWLGGDEGILDMAREKLTIFFYARDFTVIIPASLPYKYGFLFNQPTIRHIGE